MSTETEQMKDEPKATYSAMHFMAMAKDPDVFRDRLPSVIKEVVRTAPFPLGDTEAGWSQQEMYKSARRLWEQGQNRMFMWIYGEYARANGLEKEKMTKDGIVSTLALPDDLPDDEKAGWQTYLVTAAPPRELAVEALYRTINMELPRLTYIPDPSVHLLRKRMLSVPYALALEILPDITDEEAKRLFGQLTTPEDVYKKAVDPVLSISGA
jgi:hypothetical protein